MDGGAPFMGYYACILKDQKPDKDGREINTKVEDQKEHIAVIVDSTMIKPANGNKQEPEWFYQSGHENVI